jgi:UDP-N-acetylmuramoyl-tripeptide--D-alanyl-D-alanine ligase
MIHMSLADAARSIHGKIAGEDTLFYGCGTDSRSVTSGEMFIALQGEHFDGHNYIEHAFANGAAAVMAERMPAGKSPPALIVKNTRKAMGTLAGYWRSKFDIPMVAITGSNGKTTVKEMLSRILSLHAPVLSTRGNLNNDIGVPLTLFGIGEDHRYAIVEMGANHPGEIRALAGIAKPSIGLVTQCSPAHLQGFGSIEGVARAKAEIFAELPANGTAIINIDDRYAELWIAGTRHLTQVFFGSAAHADIRSEAVSMDPETGSSCFTLISGSGNTEIRLALPGRHNIQNALAAAACCVALNIPATQVKAGLEKMQPVSGRLQCRTGINRSRIYDDTYNANPGSLEAALVTLGDLKGSNWLALGDMAELGADAETYHQYAGELARSHGIERLFTLGRYSASATASFGKGATHFTSADELIQVLQDQLTEGTRLLVKGSRSMSMDRVVTGLIKEC